MDGGIKLRPEASGHLPSALGLADAGAAKQTQVELRLMGDHGKLEDLLDADGGVCDVIHIVLFSIF